MKIKATGKLFPKNKGPLLSVLCLLIILITSLQDFYGAKWNNEFYDFFESMAYKLFWLLFIPFYIFIGRTTCRFIRSSNRKQSKIIETILLFGWSFLIGLSHLLLFAFLLHIISPLFNDEPWNLGLLIKEKLTTRLYIVLVVYLILNYLSYYTEKRTEVNKIKNYSDHITVKNGRTSIIVDIHDIKWIKADGGYLELQTTGKRYIIVDSLKNMLKYLDPDQFKRIHKSTIINTRLIKAFKSRNNGDYDLLLKDGNTLRLSRNYAKPIKDLMF